MIYLIVAVVSLLLVAGFFAVLAWNIPTETRFGEKPNTLASHVQEDDFYLPVRPGSSGPEITAGHKEDGKITKKPPKPSTRLLRG